LVGRVDSQASHNNHNNRIFKKISEGRQNNVKRDEKPVQENISETGGKVLNKGAMKVTEITSK
jgi:hypothetical protein